MMSRPGVFGGGMVVVVVVAVGAAAHNSGARVPYRVQIEDPTPSLEALSVDPMRRALGAEYELAIATGNSTDVNLPSPPPPPGVSPEIFQSIRRSLSILAKGQARTPTITHRFRLLRRFPHRRSRAPAAVTPLVQWAIYDGAQATGVSPDYLTRIARRESSFNPVAQASTSSGAGLFQFVDATWLRMVATVGDRHGLWREQQKVRISPSGKPYVSDPLERARILSLRYDPQLNARLAGEFTRDNAAALASDLGRSPSAGELYVAHVLGAQGGVRLIRAAYRTPWVSASTILPAAAKSNPSIFYENGRPRSSAEVFYRLARID